MNPALKKAIVRLLQVRYLLPFMVSPAFAQEVKVVDQSAFTHNYVVSELEYIEEVKDTSKLHYMATLQITASYSHKISVARLYQVIESKATELGANLFYLQDFKMKDSTGNFLVKIYFAAEPQKKENKLKEKKGCIYLFDFYSNASHIPAFYLNNELTTFKPGTYFTIKMDSSNFCSISLTAKPKYFTLNTNNQSRFIFLNNKPELIYPRLDPGQVGLINVSRHSYGSKSPKPNEISTTELKYVLGRLLLEMYNLSGAQK